MDVKLKIIVNVLTVATFRGQKLLSSIDRLVLFIWYRLKGIG